VYLDEGPNIAANKTASSSSNQDSSYTASKAIDSDNSTRWSSQSSDPQWINVDLGAYYDVSLVKLNWEAAYAKTYKIQVSGDGTNWIDAYSTTTGDGSIDNVLLDSVWNRERVYVWLFPI
jgi:hypothetical protein